MAEGPADLLAARNAMRFFMETKLIREAERRGQPDRGAACDIDSHLYPVLRIRRGHLSQENRASHLIVATISPGTLRERAETSLFPLDR
jgi:hypothetical protein